MAAETITLGFHFWSSWSGNGFCRQCGSVFKFTMNDVKRSYPGRSKGVPPGLAVYTVPCTLNGCGATVVVNRFIPPYVRDQWEKHNSAGCGVGQVKESDPQAERYNFSLGGYIVAITRQPSSASPRGWTWCLSSNSDTPGSWAYKYNVEGFEWMLIGLLEAGVDLGSPQVHEGIYGALDRMRDVAQSRQEKK